MEILKASDAKREFGEALLKAQHGPVGIHKHGKPVAVMVSAKAYAEMERMKEKFLYLALEEGRIAAEAGRVIDGPELIKQLRQRVDDAER